MLRIILIIIGILFIVGLTSFGLWFRAAMLMLPAEHGEI